MHCWYWVSDFCEDLSIDFILGHALYMKAIHGGKTKNDRIDSFKIANLIRGGNFPLAYVYPNGLSNAGSGETAIRDPQYVFAVSDLFDSDNDR